jgi:hypothetical protein
MQKIIITTFLLFSCLFSGFSQVDKQAYVSAELEKVNRISPDVWFTMSKAQRDSLEALSLEYIQQFFEQLTKDFKETVLMQQAIKLAQEERNNFFVTVIRPAMHSSKTLEEKFVIVRKYPEFFLEPNMLKDAGVSWEEAFKKKEEMMERLVEKHRQALMKNK